jgi:hypothetical protein
VVALLLSAGQLFFAAPLLSRYYFRPDLVVTGSKSSGPKDKVLFAGFAVSNNGNAPATKVEVGFIVQENQRVTVMPNINANIVEDPSAIVKHIRIEVERLSPGEHFNVTIFPGPSLQTLPAEVANVFAKGGMNMFPAFSFIRSAEGTGRFVASERHPLDWPK